MTIHNGKLERLDLNVERVLENGDIRITEASDVRITDSVIYNTGVGVLIAKPRVIPFYSRMYIKVNSLWKEIIIYAKSSGAWQFPTKMHNRVTGIWKRVK